MTDRPEIEICSDPQGGYRLKTAMTVDLPCKEVFAVFSDAMKLEEITPPWVGFSVITPQPIVMSEGLLLDYRLKIHRIPVRWRTEISQWQPPFRFVDRQLIGPYKTWVHEHTFEDLGEGRTLVSDHVHYIPRGGRLIHELFVRRDLEKIFRFRQDKLREMFAELKTKLTHEANRADAEESLASVQPLELTSEFNFR